MAAGEEVMADEDKNPQRREQGPWRQRLGRWSTGATTGADGAAGQQGAGSFVGAALSSSKSKKPDMMQKYCWTRCTVDWCAGGVRRAVVWNRAAMPNSPGLRGYSASGQDGQEPVRNSWR